MTDPIHMDPEAERRRKARLWDSMVRAGVPKELATAFVEAGQGIDPISGRPVSGQAPGGYGVMSRIGGGAVKTAISGAAGMLGTALSGGPTPHEAFMAQRTGAQLDPSGRLGLPEPQGALERTLATGLGGAALGAVGGPAGLAGGFTGGVAQQGAAEMGANPVVQLLAALAGGVLGGKGGKAIEGRILPHARTAKALGEPYVRQGDDPVPGIRQSAAVARGNPTQMGYEAMGREGQQTALRVAQEGGRAAEPLVARVADEADNIASQFRLRSGQIAEEAAKQEVRLTDATVRRTMALQRQARTGFAQRVKDIFGPTARQGGLDAEEALRTEFEPRVNEAYTKVRFRDVPVTDEMASLMDDPVFRQYAEEGRMTHNAGVETTVGGKRQPRREIPPLEWTDAEGNIRMRDRMPVAYFDEAKKVAQTRMGDKALSESDRAKASSILNRMDAIITEHVDPQVPGYKEARGLAAEYARARDALALGRNFRTPAVRKQTRGQLDPRQLGKGEDVVAARLAEMSPEERQYARAGRLYTLTEIAKKSPNPWTAIGDLEEHAPFLTPEELGQLYAAKGLAERTRAGVNDRVMANLATEKAKNASDRRLATDPALRRVQERADVADQILGANTPRAIKDRADKARTILVDILVNATRSLARDLTTQGQQKSLPPQVRANLAELLSLKGEEFAQPADRLANVLQYQRSGTRRGAAAGAAPALIDPDRRERRF